MEQHDEESVSGVKVIKIDAAHTDAAGDDENTNPGVETIDVNDGDDDDDDDDYVDNESNSDKESVSNVEPVPDESIPRGLDCGLN